MRGRAEFEAGGEMFALRFGNNAFCAIEETFGKPFAEVAEGLGGDGFRFTVFREVFRIGLVGRKTVQEAGDLIDEIGMAEAMRLVSGCIRDALPRPPEKAAAPGEDPAAA